MAMVSAGPVKRPATDDDNDETYTPVPAKKARGPTKSSSKRQKLPKAGRSQYVIFKAALAAAAPGENPMDWKKVNILNYPPKPHPVLLWHPRIGKECLYVFVQLSTRQLLTNKRFRLT